jgi:hypothetical protein
MRRSISATRWPRPVKACIIASCLLFAGDALAFKLRPHATSTENKVSYLEQGRHYFGYDDVARWVTDHFTSPVHEEITHRIWGCEDADAEACLAPLPLGKYAPPAVLFGVQWNDNPPFALTATNTKDCPVNTTIRLPNYSKCWLILFRDASKRAKKEHFDHRSDVALIYRVHFGDMQFLHAMASWDGEMMEDTKAKILMWAELAYRTAIGEISPATPVSGVPVTGIPRVFGSKGYSVENLLTRGVPEYRSNIGQVALGSLMHMIEDSFANGHVARDEPTGEVCPANPLVKKAGRVLAFYSFVQQDQAKHGKADSRDAFEAHFISQQPHVVIVGRALKDLYDARKPWTEVRTFLDQCVFEVAEDDLDLPAGPGANFEKD